MENGTGEKSTDDFVEYLRKKACEGLEIPPELMEPNLLDDDSVWADKMLELFWLLPYGVRAHLVDRGLIPPGTVNGNPPNKIFVLRKKSDGFITLIIRVDPPIIDNQHSIDINVTSAESWGVNNKDMITESFIGSANIKWDGCSHWYFRGEDSMNAPSSERGDSYYHLCGFNCYDKMILGLLFAWKVAEKTISGFTLLQKYEIPHMKVYEQVLDDYSIEEICNGIVPEKPVSE